MRYMYIMLHSCLGLMNVLIRELTYILGELSTRLQPDAD